MKTDAIQVGRLATNCYVVSDEKGLCAVIDPGDEADKIKSFLDANSLRCECIFITHGHPDHIDGLARLKELTGACVVANAADAKRIENRAGVKPDMLCRDKDEIRLSDGLTFTVLETPGHTPGGVCYICGDAMYCGDTVFFESVGRTDFPGGSFDTLRESLDKIAALPYEDLYLYPGHMESTTLAHERAHNPFFAR